MAEIVPYNKLTYLSMSLVKVLAFSLLGINIAICVCAYWLCKIAEYFMRVNNHLKGFDYE